MTCVAMMVCMSINSMKTRLHTALLSATHGHRVLVIVHKTGVLASDRFMDEAGSVAREQRVHS